MNKMVIIYGPTTTGKTSLAVDLAKKISGEIISADSRQIYKGLDIGSGKTDFKSKIIKGSGYWVVENVKIRGFDLVNPTERFSAADWVNFANKQVNEIEKQKKVPIVCGGTGFYIKALVDGLETMGIQPDSTLRKKLEKLTKEELFQKLKKVDYKKAQSLNKSDQKNPRRLTRAIEIATSTVKADTSNPLPTKNYLLIGLTAPNDFLFKKADSWLNTRLQRGMIEEVEKLLKMGVLADWLDSLGLEYKWIEKIVSKKMPKNEAVEKLRGEIHAYIRRQKTWFSKFSKITLYDVSKVNWKKNVNYMLVDWLDKP